jgi:hypothetical protein
MCSGAMRTYLSELDALPDSTLVSMVPVGLNAKQSQLASTEGGNAVGSIMVKLGTDLDDPADRLAAVHTSMREGKEALSSMTPVQILAMSALGQAPAILTPLLKMQGLVRPPYNLIISNVPGPRTTHYLNGAQLLGTYPLSIPIVAGTGLTTPIAYRWKTQLNQNAKLPAFSSELPELDHNEVVGWTGAPGLGRFSAIFLDDCDNHPRISDRIELTCGLISERAHTVQIVPTLGEGTVERVMSLVLLGDLVSLYLAVLQGIDPSPVPIIDELKARLAQR